MSPGDLVVKQGDSDRGKKGVILEVIESSLGYKFIKVLTEEGKIKKWYADLVEALE